ncbi:MAG: cupin domain-containing protein [Verrucomicrobia bacterium]|nr:cupin domain-containing protein [Verrucomicrobiota bacterium]
MGSFYSLAFAASLVAASLCFGEEAYTKTTRANTILKTTVDTAGQKIEYPQNGNPELTGVLVEIPSGAQTGWHIHESPCVAYVLEGEIAVELESGVTNHFKAGDSFAEVRNLKHCGYNTGKTPVKILLFAIGVEGTPVSKATATGK